MSTPPRRPSATSKPAPGPASRRRREVLIALLALPVLLVLGLFVGNALTDDDTVDVAGGTPVGATPTVTAPQVQGPSVPSSSAPSSSEPSTPAPSSPAATSEAPASTPAPTTPAATTAPAATQEATAEPTTAAPTTTEPPTAAPTSSPSRASPSPTAPPSSAPEEDPDQGAEEETAEGDGDSRQARAAPEPAGGSDILYGLGSAGQDVRTWQERMSERGWILRADGIFGPRTESVVRSFQAEKGLQVDGVLGIRTWDAAWTKPIT